MYDCVLRHPPFLYSAHPGLTGDSPNQDEPLYILTHAGQTWDFSPELKQLGFSPENPPKYRSSFWPRGASAGH